MFKPVNEQHIAILGSTGSIGTSALDVIASLGEPYQITALSTHSRIDDLIDQVQRFRPAFAVITGLEPTPAQRAALSASGTKLLMGQEGMTFVAGSPDTGGTLLAAVVGAAGLAPVIAATQAGKRIALANKESLVVGGSIIMPLAVKTGAKLLPVDSEHSAIFQALLAGKVSEIRRVILTASGGPFRTTPKSQMDSATVAQALAHPTWNMGGKITIDSATMFNKAFELIEAAWLFDLSPDQIDVVIHPQSIIHSMVEYIDGNVLAQLSPPDMRTPIQYALTYPKRLPCPCKKFSWTDHLNLTFEPPDRAKFPALNLAYQVARQGGTTGAVLNAANEVAVAAFLANQASFGSISETVAQVLSCHMPINSPTLDQLLQADTWARQEATRSLASAQVPSLIP